MADLGTYGEAFERRRRMLETGQVSGPHVQMAYRITTPGDHGAEGGRPDIFSLQVITRREGCNAVQQTLPYNPDLTKTSVGVRTLEAVVVEAHKTEWP